MGHRDSGVDERSAKSAGDLKQSLTSVGRDTYCAQDCKPWAVHVTMLPCQSGSKAERILCLIVMKPVVAYSRVEAIVRMVLYVTGSVTDMVEKRNSMRWSQRAPMP